MIVNVIISTYDRIDLIKKTIDSLMNSNYPDIKTWICIDGNQKMIKKIKEYCPNRNVKLLHNKRRRDIMFSYRKIISAIDNDGAILNAADDIVFYPGTIKMVVKKLLHLFPDGDGVIGLSQRMDGQPRGRKYAHCLIGPKFADRYPSRQAYCPDYIHFCGDSELGIYAKNNKRFHFFPEARIDHTRLADRTTELGRLVYTRDRIVFRERQAQNLLWGSSFELISKSMDI